MSGLQVVELPSDERGNVDLAALRQACDDTVAGLMLTNPTRSGCSRNTCAKWLTRSTAAAAWSTAMAPT